MSVDIGGFEDVSKERKSKVWINLSNTYIFAYRSTFHHNTVWVLPVGAQILGTQSSRVPEGNTQKNPKF